jgi:hypothetical protein
MGIEASFVGAFYTGGAHAGHALDGELDLDPSGTGADPFSAPVGAGAQKKAGVAANGLQGIARFE